MNELTEEKLNELEEMYEAATSGPWRVGNWIEEEKLHLIYSQPKGQLEHLIARTCFAPQSHQNATLISEMQEHLQSLISAARDALRYRKALEFYADIGNYQSISIRFASEAELDAGEKARNALNP